MPDLQVYPQSVIASWPADGATGPLRIIIENVQPEIDAGRFPIKRVLGEEVAVKADIHADGHEVLAAVLQYRFRDETTWRESPLVEEPNDSWRGQFLVDRVGQYEYTVKAWIDEFGTWRKGIARKAEAGQDLSDQLEEGARLVRVAGERPNSPDGAELREWANLLQSSADLESRLKAGLGEPLKQVMYRCDDRRHTVVYDKALRVVVDRLEARFSAWYEMFPRSSGRNPQSSATLREAEARLPEIAALGFSVVYLPPIHPIGQSFRKGPNNSLHVRPEDPGSPWAIGSPEGGHKAIHPALGNIGDFDHFVSVAQEAGLDVALDLAFQCSPDHPYVRDHPEWFRHHTDGSIQCAENPPKTYEDIFPFDFECADWPSLWQELKSIVLFWRTRGVRQFRVDNPHTKPYGFWEWLIREVKEQYPDTLFLAEAFTRPKIMAYLAKCGFSQSYTYFTWRNTKAELTHYFEELTQTSIREYLRPNLFINTPDILPEFLQFGGRPAFQIRLILAATLGASYGIYGPAFELCEARALPGTEEYLDSEKFQVRVWDSERAGHIKEWIKIVNAARRDNPALQSNDRLRFYPVTNNSLLCYAKTTSDLSNVILVVVNLDPHHSQDGWVQLSLPELGLQSDQRYQVHDLLSDAHYDWQGASNYVRLDPGICPAHLFRVLRKTRTEKDFDYFG